MPKHLTTEERVKLAASRYGKEAPTFDDVLAAITPAYGRDEADTLLWHDLAKVAQEIPPSIKLDFKVCGHLLHHRGTCKCKGTVYANRSSSPDDGTIDDIIARYQEGRSLKDVAKEFGISARRIHRYLTQRGVHVREKADSKKAMAQFCLRPGCEKTVKRDAMYCSLRCSNKVRGGSARICAAEGCDEPTFRPAYKYCSTECRTRSRQSG